MSKGFMFTAYTYSPLHAGVGQSMGVVDLPIEREKHTNYPCVYATGVKGALRAYFKNANYSKLDDVFGKEEASSGAGGAVFTDLKILLFPVRSSEGTFKWVTCKRVIERFKRDYKIATNEDISFPEIRKLNITNSDLSKIDPNNHIVLEDFVFGRRCWVLWFEFL